MRQRCRPGFSLVELIVSLGVIGLLVALLVPATISLRRAARVTQCASNLRQVGQALQAYRAERKVWPYAVHIPAPFTDPGHGWPSAPPLPAVLVPYLPRGVAVYRCPADTDQVFARCEAAAPGSGISYLYWIPFNLPSSVRPIMMTDFQGYGSPRRSVMIPMFHPPRTGMNELKTDGSVQFGWAKPAGS
jgi:prepilin-type N-terminal cleavage/methylation domain-containing protein